MKDEALAMKNALENHRSKEAKYHGKILSDNFGVMHPDLISQMNKSVSQYKFEEAEKIVDKIIKIVGDDE